MDSLELIRPDTAVLANVGYAHGHRTAAPHRDYTPRMLGPKYPPHDSNAPIFEAKDFAGLVAGAAITLGPLAAYALGFGL